MKERPAGARAAVGKPLKGEVSAPGDKSISHRALIIGALADGQTRIEGLLEAEDVMRTAAALRALGAPIERERLQTGAKWLVEGAEWRTPETALYFGNSGTGARLLMGAVAGQGVGAAFDGDASLRRRPMARALEPLRLMGARASDLEGRLPVRIDAGASLTGIDYSLPKPSAQVKSAILLAGLGAEGETVVREAEPSRDHTERMLKVFGADIGLGEARTSERVTRLSGGRRLRAAEISVPGDISSAAFLIAAATIVPGSDILIRNVGVNPLRIGFLLTLKEMGARLDIENTRLISKEPVAEIRVRASHSRGVVVAAKRAASMIDEYPILAVLAAFAEGTTRMEGLSELRVKESDRLAAIEAGLKANGVGVAIGTDWIEVQGRGAAGALGGGRVKTHMDHRIAMSFLVMGLAAKTPVEIEDASMIATSFPGFFETMQSLGAAL